MARVCALILLALGAVAAFPQDPVLRKLDDSPRFQYIQGPDGAPHLVDLWATLSDVSEALRYDPDRQNVYHLFTRSNPTVSQPLLTGGESLLGLTNYDASKRTVMLVHGWLDSSVSDFNAVLVPAFLGAADVNVIVVDWSAGAGSINYLTALANTVPSGESVARFVSWLNTAAGVSLSMYHLVGHGLGGHQVGIIGRRLGGDIPYITALDPALAGWITNDERFTETDGIYTEVIHTNAGLLGYAPPLGDADFYPNGGVNMPGCSSQQCDQARAFYYLAESVTSGGFTGRRCASYLTAMTGNCHLIGWLRMGGLNPKTGSSGIYYLETNAAPPFSQS